MGLLCMSQSHVWSSATTKRSTEYTFHASPSETAAAAYTFSGGTVASMRDFCGHTLSEGRKTLFFQGIMRTFSPFQNIWACSTSASTVCQGQCGAETAHVGVLAEDIRTREPTCKSQAHEQLLECCGQDFKEPQKSNC